MPRESLGPGTRAEESTGEGANELPEGRKTSQSRYGWESEAWEGEERRSGPTRTWTDVANGVPSDFGFALAIHPRDAGRAWIVPLESDRFRCTPEGKLRVYRTSDAGRNWKPMSKGLPQKNAYETVLRDAMAVDTLDPAGVYFGTRSGKLFGSADEGKSWKTIVDGLPPVVAVKAAIVAGSRKVRKS